MAHQCDRQVYGIDATIMHAHRDPSAPFDALN
jgi:hypothetical protein